MIRKKTKNNQNITFLNFFDIFKLNMNKIFNSQDLVHPNAFGHKIVADIIFKKLYN